MNTLHTQLHDSTPRHPEPPHHAGRVQDRAEGRPSRENAARRPALVYSAGALPGRVQAGRPGGLWRPAWAVALAIALTASSAFAASEAKWTVEDLVREQKIAEVVVSPADLRIVAWVQQEADEKKDRFVTQLLRHGPDPSAEPVQLTHGEESSERPRFSPDGRRLAFLRKAAGADQEDETKSQIWLMDGGEPRVLTAWERGIRGFEWRDAGRIVFFAQEAPGRREQALKEKKDNATVVEDEENELPVRLFELQVKNQKVARLTTNQDRIQFLAVSPDGRYAVTFHERSLRFTYDNAIPPHFFFHDLASGRARRFLENDRVTLLTAVWAPDSSRFYVILNQPGQSRYIAYGTIPEVWEVMPDTGVASPIPLDWDQGVADFYPLAGVYGRNSTLAATADGFVVLLADGAKLRPARCFRRNGIWRREFLEGPGVTELGSIWCGARAGEHWLYAIDTAANRPPQLVRARLDGSRMEDATAISRLNPAFAKKPKAERELIRWRGANGDEVEGLLHQPADARESEKRPLVVMIHGGPSAVDADVWNGSWKWTIPLHLARGARVLQPNYHGSAHYGRAFLESIAGGRKYYDLPVEDIERGVDALIERGLVDPERNGVLGWSNGGILTLGLITRNPARYKAAASGAAGWEWSADTAITPFGLAFNDYYFGGVPWLNPERYRDVAPFYDAHKVRTPLIIFHGDADTAVPIHHGWMQFRPVQRATDTTVRFVIFPGAEHALEKPSEQRRKISEELAWFDRHLYGLRDTPQPWLKPQSPLAGLLKRREALSENGRHGVRINGKLVPETVRFSGMQIGRFEVTRAQYVEFDPTVSAEGRENGPITGVSYDNAKAYCVWLSGVTGTSWRLPNADEADTLYQDGAAGENTLDYWAGYEPNPEDARALVEPAESLRAGALLQPVGSFAPEPDSGAFDLGGNAAEWVELSDGRGAVFGGSADQPARSLTRESKPRSAYVGFRVVREDSAQKAVRPE
ncbi:MAG: prolyl oligopeptidase family serine peptidase [Verrucomicrobiales bacterium]|nr:prolyl oligopeptidase family serine peptidase [Verrucomicrobiales bacterium]